MPLPVPIRAPTLPYRKLGRIRPFRGPVVAVGALGSVDLYLAIRKSNRAAIRNDDTFALYFAQQNVNRAKNHRSSM